MDKVIISLINTYECPGCTLAPPLGPSCKNNLILILWLNKVNWHWNFRIFYIILSLPLLFVQLKFVEFVGAKELLTNHFFILASVPVPSSTFTGTASSNGSNIPVKVLRALQTSFHFFPVYADQMPPTIPLRVLIWGLVKSVQWDETRSFLVIFGNSLVPRGSLLTTQIFNYYFRMEFTWNFAFLPCYPGFGWLRSGNFSYSWIRCPSKDSSWLDSLSS